MIRPFWVVVLLFLVRDPSLAAQVSSPSNAPAATEDHSKEAFVVEQFTRKEKFENDGTSVREDSERLRIQSEAGVQQYGLLSFSYASGTGTFEILYVRVRKPDGSVVETPAESVQDMAAEITRQAPSYSDLHEKHVAVKGLSVGDVLEYRVQEHTTKPLAPAQFWTSYQFTHDRIVLDELLEISVPRERAVKFKSAKVQPAITESGGYRVYTWHGSNLTQKDETNAKREATEQVWQQTRGRFPQPDVLLSSFASWDEVGRWYGDLQAERVKPTAEVSAKAAELTRNASTDEAKIRLLYNYVSTQFRYIGVSFGVGRYQPHSAAEVLANQYGDCKDKHTLLASLLAAVGIPAYPALIDSSRDVDADVPSPGQFDHVITIVPKDGALLWLDTTPEVGPYQYLVSNLRDKHALAVWKDKPPILVSTPAALPYPSVQVFNMEGKLSEAGILEAQADLSARGDVEYLLRSGFRTVPLPQWKELGQRISLSLGFGGEVSEVIASSPEKTDEPFHFSYKYVRKDYGDWLNRRILVPMPILSLLAPSDDDLMPDGPLYLGALLDIQCHGRIELPSGYRPQVPEDIHLKFDFAQYDATYQFKDGKLIGERHLKSLLQEVPVGERSDYKQFMKTVSDDYGSFIPLFKGGTALAVAKAQAPGQSTMNALRNLPNSSNEEATRLESDARDAIQKNDIQGATSSLYRAVSTDPKFTRAWVLLGTLLLSQKQKDAALDAFHKAIASDPEEPAIPKALGYSLMANSQFDDAISLWQDFVKAHPKDADGPANLGKCLRGVKRYSEAAKAYEAALEVKPDMPSIRKDLGSVYLLAGERDKAAAAFERLVDSDEDGIYLNDIAYEMADADLKLPLALEYARKAVTRVEKESQDIALSKLDMDDLRKAQTLAAYWDTIGWVDERTSKLDEAEQYLRASWNISQDGVVGGHLCHLYRREHKDELAIRMCRMAIFRMPTTDRMSLDQYGKEMAAAQENLDFLTNASEKSGAGKSQSAKAKNTVDASSFVINEREFKMPRFLPGTESAEFFVLLASDGKSKSFKIEDTKFISGSDKMKLQGKQLKTIDFKIPAPSNVPSRFVRRGILGCYQYSGCSFMLLDPDSVHSLE